MAADYVSVTYDTNRTPKTGYPDHLANYLSDRYKLLKGSKLCDIACGRGDFLRAFEKLGFDCSAVDLANSSIEMNKDFNVKQANISKEPLPFNDNSFDIVFSKSIMEHIENYDLITNEYMRILKPGGILIMLIPDWSSQMPFYFEDFTHVKPYTKDSVMDLLNIYGFESVESELFYQHEKLWDKSGMFHLASILLRLFLNASQGRWLTKKTGIKLFRWSVEAMVLGTGKKPL